MVLNTCHRYRASFFAWQLLVFSVLDERLGLLDHPRFRRSEVNLPRFDV